MNTLLKSRRFWMAVLDTVVSIAGFVVAHYVPDPNTADLIKFLVVSLQPLFVTIIVAFTVEDVTAIRMGVHPNYPTGAKQP